MKKRNEWVRKALKRKKKEKDRGIVDLMMVMHHFFGELPTWIDEMEDPRHPSYITYSQSDLFYMGLMKNLCGVKTMHAMEEQFNEKNCIETIRILPGDENLSEMPHSDTVERQILIATNSIFLYPHNKKQRQNRISKSRFCRCLCTVS